MDNELTHRKLTEALKVGHQLAGKDPSDLALNDTLKQLAFLESVYERDRTFRSVPKGRMTFGVIAAKEEYDVVYPEFAHLLHDLSAAIDAD
ncbi:MAG TPA: immunity protein Tsi6 family protein [Bryobacteraceae bacterium]|nr:immunity protein Tsi6 family protein [Bryobacteraceae bacterium]